jgi:hypothetical protein
MNRLGIDQYWLGLYWRNNLYDLEFIKEMCDLCFECKIGKYASMPWKSFIVKRTKRPKTRLGKILVKKRNQYQTFPLELNWHLPVAVEWALNLKTFWFVL